MSLFQKFCMATAGALMASSVAAQDLGAEIADSTPEPAVEANQAEAKLAFIEQQLSEILTLYKFSMDDLENVVRKIEPDIFPKGSEQGTLSEAIEHMNPSQLLEMTTRIRNKLAPASPCPPGVWKGCSREI